MVYRKNGIPSGVVLRVVSQQSGTPGKTSEEVTGESGFGTPQEWYTGDASTWKIAESMKGSWYTILNGTPRPFGNHMGMITKVSQGKRT